MILDYITETVGKLVTVLSQGPTEWNVLKSRSQGWLETFDRRYFDTYKEAVNGTATGTSDFVLTSPVPTDEIWVVTTAAYEVGPSNASSANLRSLGGVGACFFDKDPAALAYEWHTLVCDVHLGPGEQLRANFSGIAAGDVMKLHVHGYKMHVP